MCIRDRAYVTPDTRSVERLSCERGGGAWTSCPADLRSLSYCRLAENETEAPCSVNVPLRIEPSWYTFAEPVVCTAFCHDTVKLKSAFSPAIVPSSFPVRPARDIAPYCPVACHTLDRKLSPDSSGMAPGLSNPITLRTDAQTGGRRIHQGIPDAHSGYFRLGNIAGPARIVIRKRKQKA